MQEAGADAKLELAFTIADGMESVACCCSRCHRQRTPQLVAPQQLLACPLLTPALPSLRLP